LKIGEENKPFETEKNKEKKKKRKKKTASENPREGRHHIQKTSPPIKAKKQKQKQKQKDNFVYPFFSLFVFFPIYRCFFFSFGDFF